MKIVIIGNGIAGVTAARHLRKLDESCQITLLSSESEHHFSRTALMYIYMGHLRYQDTVPYEADFWQKNRIELVFNRVESIDFMAKNCLLRQGESCRYDKLILATGSTPSFYGWQGQHLEGVQGLYSLQDLEKVEKNTFIEGKKIKHAVVVGGGLIGIELAEMLHSKEIAVTMLIRENAYWSGVLPAEESEMVEQQLQKNGIKLLKNVNLERLIDENGDNRVDALQYSIIGVAGDEQKIATDLVGITTGVQPNIDFLRHNHAALAHNKGILVDSFLQTSVPDVYAIGDCAELKTPETGRRAIEAVWYTGRMMGETVAYNVLGNPVRYSPRLWFNSAKFFDLEYQTYGNVPPKQTDGLSSLFWKNETSEKAVRIMYQTDNQAVVGFNTLGIRYRHEVCEKWILEKTPLEIVLQNLSLANFDPEFYKEYEAEIAAKYTAQTGKKIVLSQKRRLDSVLAFLKR